MKKYEKGSEKMEKEFGTFRKAAFGGFNRKDVIDYIEKMKNETYEYKKQVEETVRNLNQKICELEKAASFIQQDSAESPVCAASVESAGDIGEATKHLKNVADELCRSLGEFIEKLARQGLCDAQPEQEADELPPEEKTETDKVESILSVMSFLDEKPKEKSDSTDKTTQTNGSTDVEEILSALSFLG